VSKSAEQDFKIVGSLLCLDFVNTAPMLHGERAETLRQFPDLVAWCRAAGVLNKREAQDAEARWAETAEAEAAFAAAIELRAALRTLIERIVAGKPVRHDAIDIVNRVLASRLSYRRLVREGHAFRTILTPQFEEPIHLLVPVAESVVEFLEQGEPMLIRQCENPSCGLYFYDATKNRSRRWCSMEVCGSRSKAAAYYRRRRASQTKLQDPGHPRDRS
jgi:predicted RNA-binding Zn ribbon-like protein